MRPSQNYSDTLKLDERVYLQLLDLIESGQFSENARLPSEKELSERFKVSRPILRQALTQLRNEGLIISRQGAGSFVMRRPNANLLDYGQLRSLSDVRKCLEFRRGLESEAASQAALKRSESHVKGITKPIEAMYRAITDGNSGVEEDFTFHLAVAQATDNRFFVVSLEALRSQIFFGITLARSLSVSTPQQRVENIVAEHSRILEAIKKGDAEVARKTMTDHLGSGIKRLFK